MDTDRRATKRHSIMGLISSLSDGKACCIGVIEDVSITGLRVAQIPSHFDPLTSRCSTIVHGPHRDYTIVLQPCWRTETRPKMYNMIGFQIDNPPAQWQEFVKDRGEPSDLFNSMREDSGKTAV